MSKRMYCNHCGAYVGECGHGPGMTNPVNLSGTCGQCEHTFSVTCNGDCLITKEGGINETCNIGDVNRMDPTIVWECACAKCGFSWTDNEGNTNCPECGSDEGICVEREIPSTPIMPND